MTLINPIFSDLTKYKSPIISLLWWLYREIIESALSLRDKDRLRDKRDRESLTTRATVSVVGYSKYDSYLKLDLLYGTSSDKCGEFTKFTYLYYNIG